ncbi:MAG TPA: 50S ribosomal protein L11 methyltransferase [Vicinamibacterales bacterium]|nr:50S ribosomal protein L11 methyltransferase [Vicinamibacterales bacterium]
MYSLAAYASMMADLTRIDAYVMALRHAVRADSIVADLGAGTGTFALLAARLGARKVHAIEPDEAIHVGRAIAAASGLADRIDFIQARSTDVVLEERATIIVSDMRGTLPLFERHIPSIVDARDRLLAPSGVLIPRRDRLRAAIVEAPDVYADHVAPWRDRTYDLDLRPAQEMLANTWRRIRLAPDMLLSDSESLATLDYRERSDPDLDAEATWAARRAGTAHGLCVWFDSELIDGVTLSNAPDQPHAIYAQAFFPFATPVALDEGASISVRLQANLVGDDYLWRWTSHGRTQSTLYGLPLGASQLPKSAADHVPALTTEGEIDLFIMRRMQESIPLGEIASELLTRFPSALRNRNAALGRAGELARKYSKG